MIDPRPHRRGRAGGGAARMTRLVAAALVAVLAAACVGPVPAVIAAPSAEPAETGVVPQEAAGPVAVLVGAGDVGWCGTSGDEATAKLVAATAGIVIVAGDVAYPNGSTQDFAKCYDPSWGQFKARTRPAPGNHEYYTKGAAPYFAYFGTRAGKAGRGWYSYDAGTWHVVVLNSECAAVGGCGVGSPQEVWLRKDLAAHPVACTVAYWHVPLFSSGPHGSDPRTKPLWQALYDAGAELVINGHDHDYERFAPMAPSGTLDVAHGIREIVVGTGGAPLYPFVRRTKNSEVKGVAYGVVKLTLRPGAYSWEFLPVAGASFRDAGSGTCH
ncbi:MAG: metallophosphoesterase [Chloroflexota bacterium]